MAEEAISQGRSGVQAPTFIRRLFLEGVPPIIVQRFWARVDVRGASDCWPWKGGKISTHNIEYGQLSIVTVDIARIRVLAHRFSYFLHFGPVPDDKIIDHLCRNGLCVNPYHLESITNNENILRGEGAPARNARKTHCGHGHELIAGNIWLRKDGRRACKRCDARRWVNPVILRPPGSDLTKNNGRGQHAKK